MCPAVRSWLKLKLAISFADNCPHREEHTEHRKAQHISWMETVPLRSAGCPRFPSCHPPTDVMTKEKSKMLICQNDWLSIYCFFYKLRAARCQTDEPSRLKKSYLHEAHMMLLHWLGGDDFSANALMWLSTESVGEVVWLHLDDMRHNSFYLLKQMY